MRVLLVTLFAAAVQGAAVAKPEQIRSDQDPVFHYYLQTYPKNSRWSDAVENMLSLAHLHEASMVVLGPVGTSEYFNIAGSIQSTNSSLYINIGSDSTSYKTLTFDKTATTTGWGLEGDTIITTQTSTYGRREFRVSPRWARPITNSLYRAQLPGL
jgi:hypothetical protein